MNDLDIGATLAALHEHGVRFVLTGGVAVAAHGHVRGTEDVDIVPAADPDNLLRLGNALAALDAHLLHGDGRAFGPDERSALARGANLSVQTANGPIDVVQRVPGLPAFRELDDRAIDVTAFGIPIRVISRADLLAAKRSRGAARDLADIEALEAGGD